MQSKPTQRTVFIVDDDRGLSNLIGKTLRREGFATATASSGNEALDWLLKNHADLMLLDLKLQDVEGKELIEQLHRLNRTLPFIIITGQGDERVAVDMMKSGALDYLVKDTEFLNFVPEVVRRAMQQVETQRRLAEAEEQVRLVRKQILEISDIERQRIGQDLHDGLCQHLAGIELMSQVLEQELAQRSKTASKKAGEIARLVREAISQTRALARGLSPVTLEAEGLASALTELALNTEKMFGASCRLVSEQLLPAIKSPVATHLYRIAQEAVSNALKHGKAKEIMIRLEHNGGRLLLSVQDNGIGFSEPEAKGAGMGLHIMRYRAGMIGSSLAVERRPEGGTTVTCSVAI